MQPYISHQNRAWLQTEYDTAVRRAHDAADWQQFEAERDVLPNLKWLPTTSATPGEDHIPFWNTIRPIDDPFWDAHRPGDRWNCKCSLTSTDEQPTDIPDVPKDKQAQNNAQDGLRSNPGKSGELFSKDHPYFAATCSTCPFRKSKLAALWNDLTDRRDCFNCSGVDKKLEENDIQKTAQYKQNKADYDRLLNDPDYYDVHFNDANGGLEATHIGHNFDKKGGKYEKNVRDAGYNAGHAVVFGDERGLDTKHTEGTWNSLPFEVAGRETATSNNILKGLKHCASKRTTKIAILDYPKGGFDVDIFNTAIQRYKGLEKLHDGQYLQFDRIICIQNKEIVLEIDFP